MAGIYLHIPFCKQACYYCNFHFSVGTGKLEEMVTAIKKELILRKEEFADTEVETIYFGGGTPSLLSVETLEELLSLISKNYRLTENPEITLEANPDDLNAFKLGQLKKAGINRLSIGIQSFFDEDLKWMNRAHTGEEARKSLEEATKLFDNITIDLIYGIPQMSQARWQQNLNLAMAFGVPHISSYALTIEPKTVFGHHLKKGTLKETEDNVVLAQFNMLVEATQKAGMVHYEISNFGKPGYFSQHNKSYWEGKCYLGIGPAAHSFNGNTRSWNVANNSKYLKALSQSHLPGTTEELSLEDRYNELVMTGLRTIWGISLNKVDLEFGSEFLNYLKTQAAPHLERGILKLTNNKRGEPTILLTEKGKFLADGIASDLFIV